MKRSYTLIELLTVIFVIAVLAGLIFPAVSIVREKAKRTACSSNLRQVGALAMQFSNDRDGKMLKYTVGTDFAVRSKKVENYFRKAKQKRFEEPKAGTSAVSNKKLWTAGLLRYAKYNMNVFFCPSDERELDIFKGGDNNSSYTINYGDKDRPGGKEDTDDYVKMSSVTRSPGSVIVFAETDDGKFGMKSTETNFMNTYYKTPQSRKPHSNEFNVSYLDGHADYQRTSDIATMFAQDYFRITPKSSTP